MDQSTKDHLKGAAQVAKGKVEQAAGKVIDDKKMQAHGLADQAIGKARQAGAKAESLAEDLVDRNRKPK